MIHEIKTWMLDLDLSEFDVLTFDDGLYSQYKYHKHFLKFNKPMHFFISTGIICKNTTNKQIEDISCSDAHEQFFKYGTADSYMSWNQIKQLDSTTNCFIGGHSHTHPKLKSLPIDLAYEAAKSECVSMLQEFKHKNISITSFCFPYNDEIIGYKHHLKQFNVTEFFGKERTPIERLKDIR